jgi:hypothetical protein
VLSLSKITFSRLNSGTPTEASGDPYLTFLNACEFSRLPGVNKLHTHNFCSPTRICTVAMSTPKLRQVFFFQLRPRRGVYSSGTAHQFVAFPCRSLWSKAGQVPLPSLSLKTSDIAALQRRSFKSGSGTYAYISSTTNRN